MRESEPNRHIGVLGTGSAAPEHILTNAELETMVDTSDDWIVSRTGIKERRIADEGIKGSGVKAGVKGNREEVFHADPFYSLEHNYLHLGSHKKLETQCFGSGNK